MVQKEVSVMNAQVRTEMPSQAIEVLTAVVYLLSFVLGLIFLAII